MIYDKMSVLPPAGSIKEALFMMLWYMRQEIDLCKSLLVFDAARACADEKTDLKPLTEAFRKLVGSLFPFMADAQQLEAAALKKKLEKISDMGPLQVTPVLAPSVRQAAFSRMAAGDAPPHAGRTGNERGKGSGGSGEV